MFRIELLKNTLLGNKLEDEYDISSAIHSIYTEYEGYEVNVFFDNYCLHLTLRGDLTSIYDDVISMIENIKKGEPEFVSFFLSSTFTAKLKFSINKEIIFFQPFFTVAIMSSVKEPKLTIIEREINDVFKADKNTFIREWEKLLIEVREDLKRAGYGNELEGFDYLERLPSISSEA